MNPWLPIPFEYQPGYVGTAGFLALQGLFTAHVTGNFVTLGAALAFPTPQVSPAKLIALSMFCAVVAAVGFRGVYWTATEARTSTSFLAQSSFC